MFYKGYTDVLTICGTLSYIILCITNQPIMIIIQLFTFILRDYRAKIIKTNTTLQSFYIYNRKPLANKKLLSSARVTQWLSFDAVHHFGFRALRGALPSLDVTCSSGPASRFIDITRPIV